MLFSESGKPEHMDHVFSKSVMMTTLEKKSSRGRPKKSFPENAPSINNKRPNDDLDNSENPEEKRQKKNARGENWDLEDDSNLLKLIGK